MRLTQEQAAAVDAKAERDDVHVLAPDRILDLLDQLRDTTARAEQAEKRLDEYTSITTATEPPTERTIPSDELQRAIDAARAMSRLDECDSDERIKRVNALRADWPQYAQFDHQTFLALVFAVYMASVVDALEDEVEKRRQAERDRDALAAEVRAWRAFDAACGVRDRIAYTAALRPVHPIDTMKATDASGALQRAKGGA